ALRIYGLPARQAGGVGRQVSFSFWHVRQPVRLAGLDEKFCHVRRACLSGSPIDGISLSCGDLDRRDFLTAEERIEVLHPLFAIEADVEIDAVEGAEHADRIGAVFQYAWRPGCIRRVEVVRQLLVVELA